jgi:TPR repeat protein
LLKSFPENFQVLLKPPIPETTPYLEYHTAANHLFFELNRLYGDFNIKAVLHFHMYFSGHGVDQDFVEAAFWFHKAAEQDNVSAQFTLGFMYEWGRGVTKNLVASNKCLRIARGQVFSKVQKRMKPKKID